MDGFWLGDLHITVLESLKNNLALLERIDQE